MKEKIYERLLLYSVKPINVYLLFYAVSVLCLSILSFLCFGRYHKGRAIHCNKALRRQENLSVLVGFHYGVASLLLR